MWMPEGDGFDAPVVEGVLWGATLVVAVALFVRAARGERWTWGLVAAGLATIVADKMFDVHAVAHACGRWIAIALDPVNQLRGPNEVWRDIALVAGFVAACGVVVWTLRHDARVGRAKVLCLAGLVLVGVLLVARLAPGVAGYLEDWLSKAIELIAWGLVVSGEWIGFCRPRERRVVDGFV